MQNSKRVLFLNVVSIICLFLISPPISAQENSPTLSKAKQYTWDEFVNEFSNSYYFDEGGNNIPEEKWEELQNIHDNPINVNTATREDLLQIPFLSQEHADSIISYRNKYGALLSLSELILIKNIDYQTRKFLTVFLKCGSELTSKVSMKDLLLSGKNEIALNTTIPLNTAEGYKDKNGIPNSNKFLGDKNRLALRYKYVYKDELKYGITTEKDAGEPLACRGNALTDSYSFYFYRKQKNGHYAFSVGDYRIHFAEGLIIGNNYFYGKKSVLFDSYNNKRTISPHTSTSEYDFLRGAAGFIRLGKIKATTFVSYNQYDAILNDKGEITSFSKTGYHRTQKEQDRRNNTKNLTSGADIDINLNKWNLGLSAIISHYNRSIKPRDAEYNRYTMKGRNFKAISTHYNFISKKLSCKGEFALSERNATAFINSIKWKILPYVILTSIQRNYSKKYAEPFSNSFKSSGKISNERGIFTGITAETSNSLILRGYIDIFRFPWTSYTYRAPTNGIDYSAEVYLHNYNGNYISAEWRGSRYKCDKGYNTADTIPSTKNLIKISGNFTRNSLSLNTNLSGTCVSKRNKSSKGWLINQRITYKKRRNNIGTSLSYFDTKDYSSRLYAYENNVTYMYNNFQALYGHGIRFSLIGNIKIIHNLDIAGKYSGTKYFDRKTIGSGVQKIKSSYTNNLIFLIRYLF